MKLKSSVKSQLVMLRSVCTDDVKAAVTLTGGKCSIPATQLTLPSKFADFMAANADLKKLIEDGKGDLQWERDIPPASLSNL